MLAPPMAFRCPFTVILVQIAKLFHKFFPVDRL